MSTPKTAVVTRCVPFDDHSVLLDFEMEGEISLGFRGGQYVIIDSGRLLPDGRAAKRAYSMVSSDTDQGQFTLAARRIGEGLASHAMLSMQVGDTLKFSGPWGRLLTDLDLAPQAETGATIFAFGTGLTAALGLVNSRAFGETFASASLIWVDFVDAPFLSPAAVREMIVPQATTRVHYARCVLDSKDYQDLEGTLSAVSLVARDLTPDSSASVVEFKPADLWAHALKSQQVFLTGDGKWIESVRRELTSRGMASEHMRLEYFFNRPEKSKSEARG